MATKTIFNKHEAMVYCHHPLIPADKVIEAGRLFRGVVGSQWYFEYAPAYLRYGNKLGSFDPLNLPLRTGVFSLGANPGGIFNDAAPDWWGRQVLARMYSEYNLSELDFLVAPDSARIGFIDFEMRESLIPDIGELDNFMGLTSAIERHNELDPAQKELIRKMYHGASIGGGRPKLSVRYKDGLWLAKFPSIHDTWNEAKVEQFTMLMAGRCGIDVPEIERRGNILLVKRFDRQGIDRRIGYISAKTALKLGRDDTGSYIDLAVIMKKYGMAESLPQLFRRMAFNAIMRNTDDHPKNHAFLHNGHKLWLSPAFDIVPVGFSLTMDKPATLAMTAGNMGRSTHKGNLLSCASNFDLEREVAGNIFDEIVECVIDNWDEVVGEVGMGNETWLNPIINHWRSQNLKSGDGPL